MDQIWFAEKNVTLITTDLKGTDVADIYADFIVILLISANAT